MCRSRVLLFTCFYINCILAAELSAFLCVFFLRVLCVEQYESKVSCRDRRNNPHAGQRIKVLEITGDYCYYFIVENSITESRPMQGAGDPMTWPVAAKNGGESSQDEGILFRSQPDS